MNSFGDLSQISDIQSISRISRVNCSRIFGRVDSMQNLFDQQSSLISNVSRSNLNQGAKYLEKTVKCLGSCEESIGDYLKCRLILDCIKQATLNDKKSLSHDAVTKLEGLVLIHELKKYMHLPSTLKSFQEEQSVLGITDLPKYELSYEETLDVKSYVESLLREKIRGFILRYEQLGGNMKEVLRSTDYNMHKEIFEPHDIQLLQWKDKLEELFTQYEADLIKCNSLLDEWKKLKYSDTNLLYLEKAEYVLLQAQVVEMQARITKLMCIIRMYKETHITIDAYKALNAGVDEKLSTTMSELKEKENLKKQYESLLNTEYDEVLKTYLHFCKAIKKKKQILEKL